MKSNDGSTNVLRCECGAQLDSLDIRFMDMRTERRQECADCWLQRVTPNADTLPPLDFSQTEPCPPPEMVSGSVEWAIAVGALRV